MYLCAAGSREQSTREAEILFLAEFIFFKDSVRLYSPLQDVSYEDWAVNLNQMKLLILRILVANKRLSLQTLSLVVPESSTWA